MAAKEDLMNETNGTELKSVVAIGASTGGPKALERVISSLPQNMPAAFLVVQHMPSGFTKSFADRLNRLSKLTVKEAENGDIVQAGCVYIAPGDYHMRVKKDNNGNLRIKLDQDPPVNSHRPSVDVMLESLSDTGLNNIIAVIMTGMGSDGSKGIKKIKQKNKGYIIAQDEKTSVIYGMPKAAVHTGMVDAVLPLDDIAAEIKKTVGGV